MDHRATIGLSDRIHVELRQHNSEAWTAITCRGDPLAHRDDQDAIQIRLGDRLRARWRGLGDQRERTGLGVAKQSPERRQHRRPTLAFGHALRGAERGEADRRRRGGRDVPALDQRLKRPAERASGEWQLLGRDRGEQGRRARGPRRQPLQEVEPKERGSQTGRRRADHCSVPNDRGLRWPATCDETPANG